MSYCTRRLRSDRRRACRHASSPRYSLAADRFLSASIFCTFAIFAGTLSQIEVTLTPGRLQTRPTTPHPRMPIPTTPSRTCGILGAAHPCIGAPCVKSSRPPRVAHPPTIVEAPNHAPPFRNSLLVDDMTCSFSQCRLTHVSLPFLARRKAGAGRGADGTLSDVNTPRAIQIRRIRNVPALQDRERHGLKSTPQAARRPL